MADSEFATSIADKGEKSVDGSLNYSESIYLAVGDAHSSAADDGCGQSRIYGSRVWTLGCTGQCHYSAWVWDLQLQSW